MIDRKKLPPRIPAPADLKMKPAILQGLRERQNLRDWSEDRWTELRAVYYGMCSRVDHQLGVLIEALEDAGLYEDTAVFMLSDHGDFAGDYGLVDATDNTFEDCLVRVPLIIKPPDDWGVEARVSDAMVELVDMPATVCEIADVEPICGSFGRSLVPLLADAEARDHRDTVFCEGGRLEGERQAVEIDEAGGQSPDGLYWPRMGLQARDDGPYHGKATMCRTARMKYVRRLYECDELYNLELDPHETGNIVEERRHARALAKLKDRMLSWYQGTCDVVPIE
jgi:arylsulfatase A-like enzyme